MYVRVKSIDRTAWKLYSNDHLSGLSLTAQVDMSSGTLPLSTFSVNIMEPVALGQRLYMRAGNRIRLYSDVSVEARVADILRWSKSSELTDEDQCEIWCDFIITNVKRLSESMFSIVATSPLSQTEDVTLKPIMYFNEDSSSTRSVRSIINGLLGDIDISVVYDDTANAILNNLYLAPGRYPAYFPEQSLRERLNKIASALGLYFTDMFYESDISYETGDVKCWAIEARKQTSVGNVTFKTFGRYIPASKIFWTPNVSQDKYISYVVIEYYYYINIDDTGGLEPGDEYIQYETESAIGTEVQYFKSKKGTTSAFIEDENTLSYEKEIYKLGELTFVSGITSTVFNQQKIINSHAAFADLTVIDNGEYRPGMRVAFPTRFGEVYTGIIESATFTFGAQSVAALHVVGLEDAEGMTLTVEMLKPVIAPVPRFFPFSKLIKRYHFPKGYKYDIDEYEFTMSYCGYTMRFKCPEVIGTMNQTKTVSVNLTLLYEEYNGTLLHQDEVVMPESGSVISAGTNSVIGGLVLGSNVLIGRT